MELGNNIVTIAVVDRDIQTDTVVRRELNNWNIILIHFRSNRHVKVRWREEGGNRNDDHGDMAVTEKKEKTWEAFDSENDKAESKMAAVTTKRSWHG